MASPSLKRYRFVVTTWDSYKTYIDAESEDEAFEIGEALYNASGVAALTWIGGDLDGMSADLIGEAA